MREASIAYSGVFVNFKVLWLSTWSKKQKNECLEKFDFEENLAISLRTVISSIVTLLRSIHSARLQWWIPQDKLYETKKQVFFVLKCSYFESYMLDT